MAFNLGSTVVTIGAVTKPLDKFLAGVKNKLNATAAEKPKVGLGSILAGAAMGAGMRAFDIVLKAIEALVTAIPKAAMAAENLEHIMHRNKFMFQNMFPEIEKTINSLTRLGHTKGELGGVSARLGEMFVGMGMNERATAKLSETFLKLGVDAAAFHQIELPEYMELLEHGLEGNTKALKRMGIFLTDGQVMMEKMKLASQGMLGPFAEQNEKLAIMSIVYKRLVNFQGEAERQMKRLTGEMKNVGVKASGITTAFGELVKPIWTSAIRLIERVLVSILDVLGRNKDAIKSWADAVANAIDSVRFYFENAGLYVEKFELKAKGAFLNVVIAVHNWRTILLESFLAVGKFLYEQPSLWFKGFTAALDNLTSDIVTFANWFRDIWTRMFESNEKTSGRFFNTIVDGIKDMMTSMLTAFATGKPIEFKFRPSVAPGMAGLPEVPKFKTGAANAAKDFAVAGFEKLAGLFNLDELKKAAGLNDEQLKKIDETLKKNWEELKKANEPGKGKIPALARPQMFGAAAEPAFVGITEFAKQIQLGALGKDNPAAVTARNTGMMVKQFDRLMDIMRFADAAVAMGPN